MKKTTIWLFAILLIAAVGTGFYVGYWQGGQEDRQVVAPADPPQTPAPAPTTPQQPPKTPAQPTTPPQPDPQPTTPSSPETSDVITVSAFSDTGSLSLAERALQNDAFQLERLDWEAGRTLYISGKMRAFEAVGNYRVRDENKVLLEPEQVVRAAEGAPAWSPIRAAVPLKPAYKGKTLLIEFFIRSANDGSRTHMITVKVKPQ